MTTNKAYYLVLMGEFADITLTRTLYEVDTVTDERRKITIVENHEIKKFQEKYPGVILAKSLPASHPDRF
jgi:hypothetical protein